MCVARYSVCLPLSLALSLSLSTSPSAPLLSASSYIPALKLPISLFAKKNALEFTVYHNQRRTYIHSVVTPNSTPTPTPGTYLSVFCLEAFPVLHNSLK